MGQKLVAKEHYGGIGDNPHHMSSHAAIKRSSPFLLDDESSSLQESTVLSRRPTRLFAQAGAEYFVRVSECRGDQLRSGRGQEVIEPSRIG